MPGLADFILGDDGEQALWEPLPPKAEFKPGDRVKCSFNGKLGTVQESTKRKLLEWEVLISFDGNPCYWSLPINKDYLVKVQED